MDAHEDETRAARGRPTLQTPRTSESLAAFLSATPGERPSPFVVELVETWRSK